MPDHYLPDLHHLRLELEEAATPEGHAVRFGFNPLEFENFSWRGYAQMAPIQVGAGRPLPRRSLACAGGGQASEATGPSCGRQEGDPDLPRPPAQDCGQAERDLPGPLLARVPIRQPWACERERAGLCAGGGQVCHLCQL